ncbi:hypothetical protein ACX5I6_13235 [Arthrobacter sp. MMS24-T111]
MMTDISSESVAGIVTGDRIGKGIRTAPRDAMIAAEAQPEHLAHSFGIHRLLDYIGGTPARSSPSWS